jgi:hypothetical protein
MFLLDRRCPLPGDRLDRNLSDLPERRRDLFCPEYVTNDDVVGRRSDVGP